MESSSAARLEAFLVEHPAYFPPRVPMSEAETLGRSAGISEQLHPAPERRRRHACRWGWGRAARLACVLYPGVQGCSGWLPFGRLDQLSVLPARTQDGGVR